MTDVEVVATTELVVDTTVTATVSRDDDSSPPVITTPTMTMTAAAAITNHDAVRDEDTEKTYLLMKERRSLRYVFETLTVHV